MELGMELKLPAVAGFQTPSKKIKMQKFEEETATFSPSITSCLALPVSHCQLKDSETPVPLGLCFAQ